jgi:hypothetical protein
VVRFRSSGKDLMLLEPEIARVGDAFGNRIKFHGFRDFVHVRVCGEWCLKPLNEVPISGPFSVQVHIGTFSLNERGRISSFRSFV